MTAADPQNPSPLAGEGGARREAVGGRGGGAALANARRMRRTPTDAERALWQVLGNKRLAGWKWRRQQPVGRFIVDFMCFEARLIVEVDGAQHIDSAGDAVRDQWLGAQGFRILRFFNNDVLNRRGNVADAIHAALQRADAGIEPPSTHPSPRPSPARGEGAEGLARHG